MDNKYIYYFLFLKIKNNNKIQHKMQEVLDIILKGWWFLEIIKKNLKKLLPQILKF